MIEWYEGITEQDFTDAINFAVIDALKNGVNNNKAEYTDYVKAHLKFWKKSNIPAPESEINSIQSWLRYSSDCRDLEQMQDTLRVRMTLLMKAAEEVYAAGPTEEDRLGIYANRPDINRGR